MCKGWRAVPVYVFFFNATATTEIYTLSLHDALPICSAGGGCSRDEHAGLVCGIVGQSLVLASSHDLGQIQRSTLHDPSRSHVPRGTGLRLGWMGFQGQVDGSVEREGLSCWRGAHLAAESADSKKVHCEKRTRRKELGTLHDIETYNGARLGERFALGAFHRPDRQAGHASRLCRKDA